MISQVRVYLSMHCNFHLTYFQRKKTQKLSFLQLRAGFRPFFQIFPNSKVSNVIGNVAMKLRKPNGIVVTFLTIDFFSKKLKKRYFCNSGPVLGVLGHFFKIFPTEFF